MGRRSLRDPTAGRRRRRKPAASLSVDDGEARPSAAGSRRRSRRRWRVRGPEQRDRRQPAASWRLGHDRRDRRGRRELGAHREQKTRDGSSTCPHAGQTIEPGGGAPGGGPPTPGSGWRERTAFPRGARRTRRGAAAGRRCRRCAGAAAPRRRPSRPSRPLAAPLEERAARSAEVAPCSFSVQQTLQTITPPCAPDSGAAQSTAVDRNAAGRAVPVRPDAARGPLPDRPGPRGHAVDCAR